MIELTREQTAFVNRTGAFSVRACPGSGKTAATAGRIAAKLRSWTSAHQGIAALSFTNVAKDEIELTLGRDFSAATPVQYPHFIGTIDSFVDRYIFLPFGHLVMSCAKRPEFIGPPHDDREPIGLWMYWQSAECNQSGCVLNDFTYGLSGELVCTSPKSHFDNCRGDHGVCSSKKAQLAKQGFATQTDANYYAMRVLQDFPVVRVALAYRFPCVMLDEAQDTSDIQMRILDLLVEGGCQDMALVGDPDQAIYEWRRACPSVFVSKCTDAGADEGRMTESWRSSQHVCDFYAEVSSLPSAPKAVNPDHASYPYRPEVWAIDGEDYTVTVDKFIALCQQHGVTSPAEIAVLCRGRELVRDLTGAGQQQDALVPWKDRDRTSRNVTLSRFLFDRRQFADGYRLLERTVYETVMKKDTGDAVTMREKIRSYGVVKWRTKVSQLMAALPLTTDLKLRDWLDAANKVLPSYIPGLALQMKRDRKPNVYSALTVVDVFGTQQRVCTRGYTLGTVHSVKGETFLAVLFIAKHQAANGQTYHTILNSGIADNDELRTVYVAMTRPRRILVLAVPRGDVAVWQARFGMS